MLTQKLFVVKTQIEIGTIARAPPNKQTRDLVMRLFFSYLSLMSPPIIVDKKPQPDTMAAL